MKKSLSFLFIGILLCAAVFFCGCTGTDGGDEVTPTSTATEQVTTAQTTAAPAGQVELKVFHAGSLTKPFEELESAFEAEHSNVDVQLMPGGSTKLAKDITEIGKSADVYASADYSLIPDMLIPDKAADWYLTFAKNRMVLCYTNDSRYADEITADNWYTILAKDDIKWAFSDPNQDPCGYRTPMVLQLAELKYGDDQIFESTIGKNSNISVTEDNGTYTIHATSPDPAGTLSIRPKSVELVQMLDAGGLDYAWEYRSVAVQNGLNFIELPEAIDLSSVDFADTYKKVQIDCVGGMKIGKPIVYGVTVPANAENPEIGLEFVKMIAGETGQKIMETQGQPPIVPANGFGNVPEDLSDLVKINKA